MLFNGKIFPFSFRATVGNLYTGDAMNKVLPFRLSDLKCLPTLLIAGSLMFPSFLGACTPALCGRVMGNVDIWCCENDNYKRCAAFMQVDKAEHGIYLGEVDGC